MGFWTLLAAIVIIFSSSYIQAVSGSDGGEPFTIGVLMASEGRLVKVDGMLEGLKQYGFSEKNVNVIIKNTSGKVEELKAMAEELVEKKVDIIVTTGFNETAAAKVATEENQIPVVFIGVGCTVESGIVEGYISTGGNITGIDSHQVQLAGKKLEFLKRLIPSTENILVLYNSETTPFKGSSVFLYDAAEKLQIQLEIVDVNTKEAMLKALEERGSQVDGVMILCNLLFEMETEAISKVALENKIPVIGVNEKQVEKGILAFYGGTGYDEGIQSARIVANILKGQDPRMIPIEPPEVLEFYLNIETSRLLGIEIDDVKIPFVDHYIYTEGR